ncbi:hypothetical protein K788_0007219 [Paraburkholderia caribensis MBA4]|uniref:Uncharacterized protein n=1 Tax=Paraburkholderia caribensis MBA4 TaxID=1323664 RepID=A0A0P0R6V2_9BURK|nr:hypothetical protein K788_0007219 [Paraburkholderia caribensis MBA4]
MRPRRRVAKGGVEVLSCRAAASAGAVAPYPSGTKPTPNRRIRGVH